MFRVFLFSLFWSLPLPIGAETFTLDSAAAYALSHNPELTAARFSIEEARGRLLQSGRLSNPEVESTLKPNVRGREFAFGVGFTQRFPLTNRLRLEKAVTRNELVAAEAEVRAAEWRLSTAVKMVGVKLLSLQASRALKDRQIANSSELAKSATELAKRAEGSQAEAAQFELEAQQLSLDVLQIDAEQAALTGELRPLLGIAGDQDVGMVGNLPGVALPASAHVEVTGRADYQAAKARVDAAEQSAALAKANKWEDATAGLAAELDRAEDAPDGVQTDGFIGFRVSLPIPWWNKNEGKIKEAVATVQRSTKEAEAIALKARAEAVGALSEMKAAALILSQTTDVLLPKAKEIEDKLNGFYKQAQPGAQLADVLRAREKRLALEQARLDALRSYHIARIRYAGATGR